MKYFVTIAIGLFTASSTFAVVDMKNANFADTWTDMKVAGSGYDLRVQRTYNSRTLFNGMFGFGWCSDFETTMFVTAEGNIRITECGGGLEILFKPKNFSEKEVDQTIAQIIREVKKRNTSLSKKYIDNLRKDLKLRDYLREDLSAKLKIQGKVSPGKTYFASGREDESITFSKGVYSRAFPDGTFQKFDEKGKMISLYDRNSNYLKLTYNNKDQLVKVTDNNGRSLDYTYNPTNKKVKKIVGPGGLTSTYSYDKEDLIKVKNGYKDTYTYKYDDLHNLVQVNYPDKTNKKIAYNKDKDWVTSFTDRRKCIEKYVYEEDPKDPVNHFWSLVTKTCAGKVTNKSRYEFWHKISKKGLRYLHRAFSDINGEISDVVYHSEFGKPTSITRNRQKIQYTYNKGGMVENKFEPTRTTTFQYKNSCSKVSMVATKYYGLQAQKGSKKPVKKLIKMVKTQFKYAKPKCNLVAAKNSDGQTIALKYDGNGRIAQITDQSKKSVLIKYEARFGKPAIVTRPGLGTIRVSYKSDGSINKVDSKEGPSVAAQVANVFNNLLEIISPATSELSI